MVFNTSEVPGKTEGQKELASGGFIDKRDSHMGPEVCKQLSLQLSQKVVESHLRRLASKVTNPQDVSFSFSSLLEAFNVGWTENHAHCPLLARLLTVCC